MKKLVLLVLVIQGCYSGATLARRTKTGGEVHYELERDAAVDVIKSQCKRFEVIEEGQRHYTSYIVFECR